MDNIYDTLAKLNKVANTPKVIKEDSNGMMSKGLEKMIQTSKMNKQKNYTPFSDKQSPDGLPEKKKDNKMFEKESDVERDDRAEKAGREVKRDAKYDHRRHAGKDGKDVTGDIEYDEKHDKDGMHEASKTMVKGPDGKMVPDYAVDGKGKDDMKEGGSLKDAARAGVMARLAELAGLPAKEIEEALGDSPQDTASRIMSEVSLDEDEDDEDTSDRSSVTLDMVAPALKKLHMTYKEKADEYHTAYAEMEADGMSDEEIMNADDDIVGYVKIDDIEDKIKAIEEVFKEGNFGEVNGNNIIAMASSGDTAAREQFMQELKYAIKDNHPEVYSKLFIYDVDESVEEGNDDTNEGNEFSGALATAKKDGKAEFEVDGKKYKVEAMDSDEDAIQEDEGEDGDMPSKAHIEKMCKDGKSKKEICDMHPGCDQGKLKKMIDDCSEHMTEGGGRDMDCATCDGTGKDDDKECKSCEGSGEAQDDDSMNNESKVEETTSAGSVADGAGSGSSPYKNASVYESNEIVKRARQLNEDMSFTVSGGPDQEPTLNINASGAEAQQLGQLLKLSGLGMTPAAPHYGAMEIEVSEDQEFANSNQNEETADTNTLVNTISGGLNGQKKMAYPRASQGDNAMATLGESELVATSANQLMKQYQAFKTK